MNRNMRMRIGSLAVLTILISGGSGVAHSASITQVSPPDGPIMIGVPAPPPNSVPPTPGTSSGLPLLETLTIEPEGLTESREDQFEYPILGADGCNTRERLLKASTTTGTKTGPCTVSGQWYTWYDGEITTDPMQLAIDPIVPLEEAWDSGASQWTAAQRRDFANDIGRDISLQVVTTSVKASKGDSDPAEWLPPRSGVDCKYATAYTLTKSRWNLSVDQAEFDALREILSDTSNCNGKPLLIPERGMTPGRGPASIIGGIGAPSGTPYRAVNVAAYAMDGTVAAGDQVSIDGTFELSGLAPGKYTLLFRGGTSGTADQWYSEKGQGYPPSKIAVVAGGVVSGINVAMTAKASFTDVGPGTRFSPEIGWASTTGIAQGFADGAFRPLEPVRRDAMAAFLYRLAGSPAVPFDAPVFADVPADSEFFDEIRWLASTGITTGFPDGGFHPLEPVNRDAMAAFLHRFNGSPQLPGVSQIFSDVPITSQFAKEIKWLAQTQITTGYPNGTFRPTSSVNRDAMTAFLARYARNFG